MSKRKTSCSSSEVEKEEIEDGYTLPLLNNSQEIPLRKEIFVKKLLLCKSFLSSSKRSKSEEGILRTHADWIEVRRRILFELIDYVSVTDDPFEEQSLQLVVSLLEEIVGAERSVSSTRFAQLSFFDAKDKTDVPISLEVRENETKIKDSEWSIIQLVYELFIQMIIADGLEIRCFLKYITESFISKLFHLFRSGDVRERDYLKTVFHRIYQRFIRRRSFLRKKINEYLFSYVFEGEPCCGIREILEIQSSIVHGFAVPLKEEHKDMLFRYLMPLHREAELEIFFPQLLSCVHSFAEKDPTLIPSILSRLCSTWPKYNSMKQILYINEVEIVLQSVTESVFAKISKSVWLELLNCTCCPHFQVAERAISLWNDTRLVKMMAAYRKELLITLNDSIDNVIERHWCKLVCSVALEVKQKWIQAVPDFFQWRQLNSFDRGRTIDIAYSSQKRHCISPNFVENSTPKTTLADSSRNFLVPCAEYKVEST
ncbi:protein phosphatase 2 (formerly 2A), regulatory subunit B' [Galdieria sulphuraria]|uniref:Protein phosphatase 2 (Formerly 2A), regulatory subunit B n=1 Tax=Galdieria sulphuraria TaxID=130081 RepID=M2Y0W8_GALSU|nr:protein phosphatase 2 (formerly 2A), regulatory subunit B' [Galdieria sulphuraria]EME29573.1 protein phosphatase 2 (formerly 2A), regulatory subunit B' [Galdieria sulphuraria]|eukprot:XP_005706093.1 protein phosphatase 2 (formerly 2A), regulatory subunit B' [Galdieria sulphuraria]